MNELYSPLHSLRSGRWFKLICGASYQHLPSARNLALAYALAGADCIDVAADPAIVAAVRGALQSSRTFAVQARAKGYSPASTDRSAQPSPWLMVSLNDGEDPHFRKAEFDPTQCPSDCPRPCEQVCPAGAIAFGSLGGEGAGVIDCRCYGCGRCWPACPSQLIFARTYVSTPNAAAALITNQQIDALEIHTQVGRLANFQRLWQGISPYRDRLHLLAISCPDGPQLTDYLRALYEIVSPLSCPLIWQTDGRPMSGDLGKGATQAAIKLAQKVLAAKLPGYVQLAGGTNAYTTAKLRSLNLLGTFSSQAAGAAYGSYARALIAPLLAELEARCDRAGEPPHLENHPDLLWQAVARSHSLVSQLKPLLEG